MTATGSVVLVATTFAEIPSIVGPLVCAGAPLAAAGAVPNGGDLPGIPLTLRAGAGDDLILDWGASCLSTDTDYAVYEGTLGSFTSHVPAVCTTGGSTTVTLTPATESRYYVVVPTNGVAEGSHGRDSNGIERVPESITCLPLNAGGCP